MYESFFGFNEKPFKLVPNPAYLFLSKSHQEALAHLNYALSQGDGFVEITGEVGTGKTTLCRAFLESLNDKVEAAYIFNPKLGPKQLLQTISDEFNLSASGPETTTKDYIDRLNEFLIQEKSEGKKVILLIDEAQNLKRDVLEQLRLLSNLETNSDKLLQIVLIGQPELGDILNSYELRQIGQRITLRYEVLPLRLSETREYIQYRLSVASHQAGKMFTRSALRRIYKYSKGIPRLINIACDRALLIAFGLNRRKITGGIAKVTIQELFSRGRRKTSRWRTLRWKWAPLAGICVLLLAVSQYPPVHLWLSSALKPGYQRIEELLAKPEPIKAEPFAVREPVSGLTPLETTAVQDDAAIGEKPGPVPETNPPPTPPAERPAESKAESPNQTLKSFFRQDTRSSRDFALQRVMLLWNSPLEIPPPLKGIQSDENFFQLAVRSNGFLIHRLEGAELDLLKRINLPAVLEVFSQDGKTAGYLALTCIEEDRILLTGAGEENWLETSPKELQLHWSGVAYIPWKNYQSIWGTIPKQLYKESVVTLKMLLWEIGFTNLEVNEEYDKPTQKAIEIIQTQYGIPVDGFVGPLTKIVLYREKNSYNMPRITVN